MIIANHPDWHKAELELKANLIIKFQPQEETFMTFVMAAGQFSSTIIQLYFENKSHCHMNLNLLLEVL